MMNRTNILAIIVFLIAFGALGGGIIFWQDEPSDPQAQMILPSFSAAARTGNIAFDENCASCHGLNGWGSIQGPPLIHGIYNPGHHNDDSFYRATRQGTPQHHWNFGDMPPQPQVSQRQITAIITYIRELQEANGIVWKKHVM